MFQNLAVRDGEGPVSDTLGGMNSGTDLPTLATAWAADLDSWAIPQEILDQADQSPWIHPVAMFTVDGEIADSSSHQRAREVLAEGGSVLDIGSGGGRASFALVPPAAEVIAVDHQQGMLDAFAQAAQERGASHREFLGDWPDVADEVPEADVVVCHHVAYNVRDIVPFLQALNSHARRRVVLEVPMHHPQTSMNPLWKKFWDVDRPTKPTGVDLAAIARALGYDAHLEEWIDDSWGKRVDMAQEERVRFARIRLCLTQDHDAEVAAALIEQQDAQPHQVATLWWDKS